MESGLVHDCSAQWVCFLEAAPGLGGPSAAGGPYAHLYYFVTGNIKQTCAPGLRVDKILIFYFFVKDILSETGIFPPANVWW